MRKFAYLLNLLIFSVFLVSCIAGKQADIVTTMFPQYDFAKQIVKDKMTVSLLIPPGAEIHDYEISSSDMVAIKKSKLFIFTSLEIDSWISDVQSIGGDQTVVLDLSSAYSISESSSDDLHFWTDPLVAIQLISSILEKIIEIDPENQEFYRENAELYIQNIELIHEDIELFIINGGYRGSNIFFAGHNAMSAFGERYQIHIVSLFSDFKPDVDLTSIELITFVNQVKSENVHYLFIEELADPKAARTIVNELKKESYMLTLLELHGYHNVTKIDLEDGVTYADILLRNYKNLEIALTLT